MQPFAPAAPATTEALRAIMRSFDFATPAVRPLRPAVAVRVARRPARQADPKSKT